MIRLFSLEISRVTRVRLTLYMLESLESSLNCNIYTRWVNVYDSRQWWIICLLFLHSKCLAKYLLDIFPLIPMDLRYKILYKNQSVAHFSVVMIVVDS